MIFKIVGIGVLGVHHITREASDALVHSRRVLTLGISEEFLLTIPQYIQNKPRFFSLDHLELRLCNECNTQIANVKWENTTSYFCGEACAKSAWFDQII